jgi:hypothetical protein
LPLGDQDEVCQGGFLGLLTGGKQQSRERDDDEFATDDLYVRGGKPAVFKVFPSWLSEVTTPSGVRSCEEASVCQS